MENINNDNQDIRISTITTCIKETNSILGNYYKENVYQHALRLELDNNNILNQTEVIIPIQYKNYYVGFERADIVTYYKDKIDIILELKSQATKINSKEINQLRKYLINLKCNCGILVNFYDKLHIIKVTLNGYETIFYDNSQ